MTFRERIRRSLADTNLQAALDANAERRQAGILAAFASVPDYQERRLRAHAIKADVIAHLDEYLARFIEKATANGILVHCAADANEAIKIVLDICGEKTLVAKSKSMLSEEINLNHALQAHDIRVVETDLGEYIVQLRGERPSHIITPAVHLRRQDVGRLFAEKLGIPYTEVISVLTNTARKVLREVFLTADVGLSGVNFGVVETGTLCLVTNEGNGRMVTTVPPVHIALMGMERLVPTMDDLALFLSLLPRSATGQKLSVYTSLIHRPLSSSALGAGFGQIRHLIVLDNGRTSLRNSWLAESLYCIRCGACLNACPVFRELGGHAYGSVYPGPIGSVISGALVDSKFDYLAQASSLCGACREVCPVDIDLPRLLLRVRAGEEEKTKREKHGEGKGAPALVKLGLQLFRRVAVSPPMFVLAQRTLGLLPLPQWFHLPAFTGWGYGRDFPRPARHSFRRRWKNVRQVVGEEGHQVIRESGRPSASLMTQSLITRFTDECTALGGNVYRLSGKELPARLEEFLKTRGIESVRADATGAKYLAGSLPVPEADSAARAGITGVLCGIAETGSLLLVHGESGPLVASLLPEIHIAILKESQILSTLAEALSRPEVREAAAAVVITGPSRTADIEMTLTIGVHGPGELHVFLIDDSAGV